MHCLISVVISQWTAVYRENVSLKRRLIDAPDVTKLERPPVFRAATGCLLVVDWDREQILGALELPKPTGFLLEKERLHVALWDHDQVVTLQGRDVHARRSHPWFNHPHTLDKSERGLLVTSAGTDLIAEIDEQGALLWSFFLFEHGYGGTRFRLGQRFDRTQDYNHRYLPAALTTHPNSAIVIDGERVLATLFSTGELICIDRLRGSVHTVIDGMRRPHSIRRRVGGGYMLCDTEGGAVVLLDQQLQRERQIPVPVPWIQDAVLHEDRLLIAANRKIVMNPIATPPDGADGINCVVEHAAGHAHKRLNFGSEHRIYMVEPIDQASAETLAHEWRGSSFDTRWLKWEGLCS